MKNSLIFGFLSRLCAFFDKCFEHSLFKKITDGVSSFIKKICANSFFVNFFSGTIEKNYASGSLIFGFFAKILGWLRNGVKGAVSYVKKSRVIRLFAGFYSDLLNYSVRHFGIIGIVAIGLYSAYAIVDGAMTNFMSAVAAVAIAVCVLCCAVDASVYNLFTGSIAVKLFGKFLENDSFEEKETISLSYKSICICAAFGVAVGAAAVFTNPVYVLLFAAGLLAMGWILYDYSVGIFIVAAILPFAPTMALAGLILFTFGAFVLRFAFDENASFKRTPLDVPMIVFACVLATSAVTSFAVKSSVMSAMVYIVFILSYFLLTNSVRTKERLFSLISIMLLAALAVALYGIYQHVFGFADGAAWIDEDMFSDIETRVVSTFENPNVLGEYLLLLIPVGLAVVWGTRRGYNKLIHLAVAGALSVCMVYTYSRGNWIGLMVAVLLFFLFYDRRFVWLALIALLISPMFLPQNVINRLLSVGNMGDTSTSYRVYIWLGTLNMLKDYWLCGIGIGTEAFNRIYPLYSYAGIVAPHSHNLYLQLVTENGIIGLLVFAWLMVVYYKDCISTIISSNNKMLKALITGLAAGMAGYLVQGMFDNVWYNYRVFLMFFVIIGITASAIGICKSSTAEVEKC